MMFMIVILFIMSEQAIKNNCLPLRPKPKLIRSDFDSVYEQAFHQTSHLDGTTPKLSCTNQNKKKSALDIFNQKITVCQYDGKTHIEHKRHLNTHRLNHKNSKQNTLKVNINEDEEKVADKFIKENLSRFFHKQEPQTTFSRANGKAKVKVVIRANNKNIRSIKNISLPKQKIGKEFRTMGKVQSPLGQISKMRETRGLIGKSNQDMGIKLNKHFRSLSSLANRIEKDEMQENPKLSFLHFAQIDSEHPQPLINRIGLSERPEHFDKIQVFDSIKLKKSSESNIVSQTPIAPVQQNDKYIRIDRWDDGNNIIKQGKLFEGRIDLDQDLLEESIQRSQDNY